MIYVWLVISVILGGFGQILMKEAMKLVGPFPGYTGAADFVSYFARSLFSLPMTGAVVCYGFSFLIWLGVLSRADLSLARPLMSLSYIIVVVYGYYAGEHVTWERIFGIALILVGIFFVARSAPVA